MSAIRSFSRVVIANQTVAKGLVNSQFRTPARFLSIKYAASHEYVKVDGNIGTIGITDHAAGALGDVVFVELPSVGSTYSAGESFGSVESVKAASDVYVPVSGKVVETNSELEKNPATVNESPLEKGWFIRIQISDEGKKQLSGLMDEAAYKKHLESLAH